MGTPLVRKTASAVERLVDARSESGALLQSDTEALRNLSSSLKVF